MIKTLIGLTMVALTAASPAYYGYSPSSKYLSKSAYAIPAPAYTAPKSTYAAPVYDKAHPYSFGYDIDDGYGNNNHRMEEGDEYGHKRGSYGYTDAYGVYRKVDYVADDYGFRATVSSNEPGTANVDPADVKMYAKEAPSPVYASSAYIAPSYAPNYGYKPSYPASYSKPSYHEDYKRPYEPHY